MIRRRVFSPDNLGAAALFSRSICGHHLAVATPSHFENFEIRLRRKKTSSSLSKKLFRLGVSDTTFLHLIYSYDLELPVVRQPGREGGKIRRMHSEEGTRVSSRNREDTVVLLISGKRQFVISSSNAQQRKADGVGQFDGHTRIHWIEGDKSRGVLAIYGIPNHNGRCPHCEDGKCRTMRVSVMLSTAKAPPPFAEPWTRMRVKGDRRGRKQNFTVPTERELDPRRMAAELRELSSESRLTGAFSETFSDPDKLARELELERNVALANGGPDAAAKLDAKRRKDFIETLNRIEAKPLAGMWGANGVAEYIAKIRRLVFPLRDAEVEDLSRAVGVARALSLHTFLDEIEDHAAAIMAARCTAAAARDRRINNPEERAKLDKHIREIALLKELHRSR